MPPSRPRQDITAALGVGRASNAGNTRTSGKEQYYTPAEVATRLTQEFIKLVPEPLERLWVEPAGGTGAFVEAITAAGVPAEQVWSGDIEPRHELVTQCDFLDPAFCLDEALSKLEGVVQTDDDGRLRPVCVTNPPFGRNNSLSVPFINKLARTCEYIGFVVPRSWRKWSVTDRLDLRAHLISDTDLSIDYVGLDGLPATEGVGGLATVFQVWQLRDDIAPRTRVVVPDRGYISRTTPAEADVELVLFGHSSGAVRENFDRSKKLSTSCYLKVRDEQVLQALHEVDYTRFNTAVAFVPALGLKEVMFLLNEYADEHGWE